MSDTNSLVEGARRAGHAAQAIQMIGRIEKLIRNNNHWAEITQDMGRLFSVISDDEPTKSLIDQGLLNMLNSLASSLRESMVEEIRGGLQLDISQHIQEMEAQKANLLELQKEANDQLQQALTLKARFEQKLEAQMAQQAQASIEEGNGEQ